MNINNSHNSLLSFSWKYPPFFPASFGCLVSRCRLSFKGFNASLASVSPHSIHWAHYVCSQSWTWLSQACTCARPNPLRRVWHHIHFHFFSFWKSFYTSAKSLQLASSAATNWSVFNNWMMPPCHQVVRSCIVVSRPLVTQNWKFFFVAQYVTLKGRPWPYGWEWLV